MAWTVTHTVSVFGNKVADLILCDADAATQVVQTKCSVVEAFSIGPISMFSGAPTINPNLDASSATANGSIWFKSCTTGDRFYINVFGH